MRLQLTTFNPTFHQILPLAPQYLRAAVQADPELAPRVEVKVCDYPPGLIPVAGVHGPGLIQLLVDLETFRPRVLGLSCYMWNIWESLLFCDAVRAAFPDIYIVLGGQEVSGEWGIELMRRHPSI